MAKFLKINIWFYITLILLLSIFITVYKVNDLLNSPSNSTHMMINKKPNSDASSVTVKDDLMNDYLHELETKDLMLYSEGNSLYIKQHTKVLSNDVTTQIVTKPKVIGKDLVQLKINSIHIGNLPLSKSQSLAIVESFGNMPKEIQLNRKDESFYYELKPIHMGNLNLSIDSIDEDGWHFKLLREK